MNLAGSSRWICLTDSRYGYWRSSFQNIPVSAHSIFSYSCSSTGGCSNSSSPTASPHFYPPKILNFPYPRHSFQLRRIPHTSYRENKAERFHYALLLLPAYLKACCQTPGAPRRFFCALSPVRHGPSQTHSIGTRLRRRGSPARPPLLPALRSPRLGTRLSLQRRIH